jgi:hypothetical protein
MLTNWLDEDAISCIFQNYLSTHLFLPTRTFPARVLYAFHFSLLTFIILCIVGEVYMLWSFSLCSPLQLSLTPSVSSPNILVSVLHSNTFSPRSSLNGRDQRNILPPCLLRDSTEPSVPLLQQLVLWFKCRVSSIFGVTTELTLFFSIFCYDFNVISLQYLVLWLSCRFSSIFCVTTEMSCFFNIWCYDWAVAFLQYSVLRMKCRVSSIFGVTTEL